MGASTGPIDYMGGLDGPPRPPFALGSAPAEPWRSSIPLFRSSRPGKAVALLDHQGDGSPGGRGTSATLRVMDTSV
jgi:hypothetical protein